MSSEWPWRTRSVSCQRQPQNFGFRDVATQHDGCVRLGGRWVCTGSVQNVPIRRSLNPSYAWRSTPRGATSRLANISSGSWRGARRAAACERERIAPKLRRNCAESARQSARRAAGAAHLRPVERREAVCEIVAEAAAVEEEFLPVLAAAEDVARGARQHEAPRRAVGVGAPRLRPPPRVEAGAERARVGARGVAAHDLGQVRGVHAVPEPRGRRLGEAGDEERRQHRLRLVLAAEVELEALARRRAVRPFVRHVGGAQPLALAPLGERLRAGERVEPRRARPVLAQRVRRHPLLELRQPLLRAAAAAAAAGARASTTAARLAAAAHLHQAASHDVYPLFHGVDW